MNTLPAPPSSVEAPRCPARSVPNRLLQSKVTARRAIPYEGKKLLLFLIFLNIFVIFNIGDSTR